MSVPHKDPDPPPFVFRVNYAKEDGLTWAHFHPESTGTKPSQRDHEALGPHWKRVADDIHGLRTRFVQHNPKSGNPRCCSLDRSAVLAVFQEALAKLEHASDIDSRKIHLEVMRKVTTILDLRTAEPNDPVFLTKDAFITPLEPHYAQPRLDYYNRGTEDADDSFYYTGIRRLIDWRKEGWPNVYPANAVEREKREREERQREGRTMLRDTPREGLLIAYGADPMEWGEEVDADPDRPWK